MKGFADLSPQERNAFRQMADHPEIVERVGRGWRPRCTGSSPHRRGARAWPCGSTASRPSGSWARSASRRPRAPRSSARSPRVEATTSSQREGGTGSERDTPRERVSPRRPLQAGRPARRRHALNVHRRWLRASLLNWPQPSVKVVGVPHGLLVSVVSHVAA